jgi:hypothetical protein
MIINPSKADEQKEGKTRQDDYDKWKDYETAENYYQYDKRKSNKSEVVVVVEIPKDVKKLKDIFQ